MKKISFLLLLTCSTVQLTGCLFTKIVTVPMRVGGAVISVIPVAGNCADKAIDEVADKIDDIPL